MIKRHSSLVGKAGEYMVMSKLLLLGYNPAIAVIDDGVDIILDNGIKIQVKTSSKINHKNVYPISLSGRSWYHQKVNKNPLSNKSDFVIIWTIDEDNFYIIPSNLLLGRKTLHFRPYGKYKNYCNKWENLVK